MNTLGRLPIRLPRRQIGKNRRILPIVGVVEGPQYEFWDAVVAEFCWNELR